MSTKPADTATLVMLCEETVANAQDFLAEAQWLLRRQRWGRAQTFAILGREELGKASVMLAMAMMPPQFRAQVPLDVRDHKVKLWIIEISRVVFAYLSQGPSAPEFNLVDATSGIAPITEDDNLAKQRGLYVDSKTAASKGPATYCPSRPRRRSRDSVRPSRSRRSSQTLAFISFCSSPTQRPRYSRMRSGRALLTSHKVTRTRYRLR